MTDPYGRNNLPKPPKRPRHFSILRPFALFFGLCFRIFKRILWLLLMIPWLFAGPGRWINDINWDAYNPDAGPLFGGVFVYALTEGVLALLGSIFLGFTWWCWLFAAGVSAFLLFVYFAFQLDETESLNHWSAILIGRKFE